MISLEGKGACSTNIPGYIQTATHTFAETASSALAAMTVVKGVVAAGFVPLGRFIYGGFGLGLGGTTLGLSLCLMNISVAPLLQDAAFRPARPS